MPYFIVERYWPGVVADNVTALAIRLRHAVRGNPGAAVRYLGSVLMIEDDVVQCRFEGPDESAVRLINDAASARYDRILHAVAYAP